MAVSADYLTYVTDQLSAVRRLMARRMFGGVGLYADDLFFALIDDDTLYFKVDDSNRADYVARGCEPFRPFADDPTYSMSYFQVPPEILEDPDELGRWAKTAIAVAVAQNARKKAKKSVTKSAAKKRAAKKRASRHAKAKRARARSR